MKTLRSYARGEWYEAGSGFTPLVDPCTEAVIARASSHGLDFEAAREFARREGGPALRAMQVSQRAGLLLGMSRVLTDRRDELIGLSVANTGSTRKDAKFDVDGAIFTLAHYAQLGEALSDRRWLIDGGGIQLARSPRFWGQHLLVPLSGVAVHINAFNFPAWGFAEKLACALLAGVPVITKPATSTAWVAQACAEAVIELGILPAGALTLICGSTGDLLGRLGPQDVVAFTGSAATALELRRTTEGLGSATRFNVEADSLNAAILAPDVASGSETWAVFLREVEREITQKSGQKCTAVRRILVPRDRAREIEQELAARLAEVVTGNPADPTVTMGPLATAAQLAAAESGVARLLEDAELVLGRGRRVDGVGAEPGKGFFFAPTLLRVTDGFRTPAVHLEEVFAPVATIVPYDGSAGQAAELVALGGGTLVTSLYSDDREWTAAYVEAGGSTSGRLYVGSQKVAAHLPGSGVVLPQLLHGGPGRAGGGEELGGLRGLSLYLQRVAVAGDRSMIEALTGVKGEPA